MNGNGWIYKVWHRVVPAVPAFIKVDDGILS